MSSILKNGIKIDNELNENSKNPVSNRALYSLFKDVNDRIDNLNPDDPDAPSDDGVGLKPYTINTIKMVEASKPSYTSSTNIYYVPEQYKDVFIDGTASIYGDSYGISKWNEKDEIKELFSKDDFSICEKTIYDFSECSVKIASSYVSDIASYGVNKTPLNPTQFDRSSSIYWFGLGGVSTSNDRKVITFETTKGYIENNFILSNVFHIGFITFKSGSSFDMRLCLYTSNRLYLYDNEKNKYYLSYIHFPCNAVTTSNRTEIAGTADTITDITILGTNSNIIQKFL